mmetsp:Transcript_77505/g.161064  ORF Transcript_77505/g.161064 Transcript_77505/m.161064 type:complete len:408 (-) Transcript_77505:26-1249(-)|eukprot:CAMPEP_0206528930 /NCGR_PEP_ID=MMETSP0325_2-20121206/2288_1 /ASSEMBLY_ACC=CAM_ASM_000347 /TAXON_ID=2866 /ORGANISM="Crypthecodinium cohnii, Strain Seligo" /LENGTH=407 /DNA_ID=CAMNT_0054024727 /DNA_START=176 /DNA_END=1399 /DNA_ORIENTATION=-
MYGSAAELRQQHQMPAGMRPLQLPVQQPLSMPMPMPMQYPTVMKAEAVGQVLTSHHFAPVSSCHPAVAGRPVIRRILPGSRSTIGSTVIPQSMAGWVQVSPMPLSARATLGATPAAATPPRGPKPRAFSTDTIRGRPMSASGLSGSTCASATMSTVGLVNPPSQICRGYSAASATEQILLPHRTAARLEEEAAEAKQLCRRLSEDLEGLNKRHQEALDEAAKLAREKAAALTSVRELHRAVELLEKENQLLRQALHGTLRNSFDLSSLLGSSKAAEFTQHESGVTADGHHRPHPRESPRRSKDHLTGVKAPSTSCSTSIVASPVESDASCATDGPEGAQWRRGSSVNLPLDRIRIAPPRPELSGPLPKAETTAAPSSTEDALDVADAQPGVAAVIWRPTPRSEQRRG